MIQRSWRIANNKGSAEEEAEEEDVDVSKLDKAAEESVAGQP